jgi:ribosome-interacting GTPase 1
MPTNLPPEAVEVERRYRAASSAAEKIACLEELLSLIPKHKGTDKLRAGYRRQLSKLRAESKKAKKGAGRQHSAFLIDKEGAGQVVLIGAPNVGKSALVAALTNADPEVGDAPFTTWQPTPGMMLVENVQIQLIDTPPLNRDYVEPELLDLIRRADVILLVVDLQTEPVEQLEETVALLQESSVVPAHLEKEFSGKRPVFFKPLLVVPNKCDDEEGDELFEICCELLEHEWPMQPVSAITGRNLERMKWRVFELLDIIRVYSKPPGKEPDLSTPFVLKKGSTVEEFAGKVHQDFLERLKAARIWGNVAYEGQMVARDHELADGDVVELRI